MAAIGASRPLLPAPAKVPSQNRQQSLGLQERGLRDGRWLLVPGPGSRRPKSLRVSGAVHQPKRGGKRRIRGVARSILGRDRPGGGGASLERTRLWPKFPANRENNREFCKVGADRASATGNFAVAAMT